MSHLAKVTLIHGDYQKISREFLDDIIKSASNQQIPEIVRLEGKHIDLTTLVQACESNSLLSLERLVVLENLFSNRSRNQQGIIGKYISELISRPHKTMTNPLVLWDDHLLSQSQLKPFVGASIKVFKIPATIFRFLDSLAPGKQAVFIPQYQHLIKTESPEAILVMISRQIKLLIQISDPNYKLPAWQLNKLAAQRRLFTDEGLVSFLDELVSLDRNAKRGKLVGQLSEELLMLLLNIC